MQISAVTMEKDYWDLNFAISKSFLGLSYLYLHIGRTKEIDTVSATDLDFLQSALMYVSEIFKQIIHILRSRHLMITSMWMPIILKPFQPDFFFGDGVTW